MKTHIEYLLILYFIGICIPSKSGKIVPQRSEVYSTSTGSGPSGLLWVTYAQWGKLPGGRSNNPRVRHWAAPSDAILRRLRMCAYIGQIKRDGCWQTGCVKACVSCGHFTSMGELHAASNGNPYLIHNSDTGRRFLVNPGNSVDLRWVDGEYGKPFPSTSVFGDKTCDLRVATYYNSWNHIAPWTGFSKSSWRKWDMGKLPTSTRAQGAQVDKDGYVYWPDNDTWQWDSHEYKLLTTIGIKKYHIISINFKPEQGSKRTKKVVTTSRVVNHGNFQERKKVAISIEETETSHWDHSITWNVQHNGNFEISAGPKALAGSVTKTFGYAIDVGGQHSWGEGKATRATVTSEQWVTVPAKHRKNVKLIGKKSNVDLPYEAKVRLTYDDGTERIVTDIGKWRGVFVSDFQIFIEEAEPI